jgi:hypothetical protein
MTNMHEPDFPYGNQPGFAYAIQQELWRGIVPEDCIVEKDPGEDDHKTQINTREPHSGPFDEYAVPQCREI